MKSNTYGMVSVLSLGRRKISKRSSQVCDSCRQRKVKCPNIAAEKPESCHPCARCVRKGRPCKYGGSCEFPKTRQQGEYQNQQDEISGQTGAQNLSRLEEGSDFPMELPFTVEQQLLPNLNDDYFSMLPPYPQSAEYDGFHGNPEDWDWNAFLPPDEPSLQQGQSPAGLTGAQPSVFTSDNLQTPLPVSTFKLSPTIDFSTPDTVATGATLRWEYAEVIEKFFNIIYIVMPVLDKTTFMEQLATADDGRNDSLSILLAALRLLSLAGDSLVHPTAANDAALRSQIKVVEDLRSGYDFAEEPDLDTVVVSICLFSAYHTSGRLNRALLYLAEAYDFFGFYSRIIDKSTTLDRRLLRRMARIELVLANTQSVTHSLFSKSETICKMHPALSLRKSIDLLGEEWILDPFEKRAEELLIRLTKVHMQPEADEEKLSLQQTTGFADDCLLFGQSYGGDQIVFPRLDSSLANQLQTADVAISDHWRSIETIVGTLGQPSHTMGLERIPRSDRRRVLVHAVSERCLATLACTSALSEGALRVVGLHKLARIGFGLKSLIDSGSLSSSLGQSRNILAGILFTIARADYECGFADRLRGCFELATGINKPARSLSPSYPASWNSNLEIYGTQRDSLVA